MSFDTVECMQGGEEMGVMMAEGEGIIVGVVVGIVGREGDAVGVVVEMVGREIYRCCNVTCITHATSICITHVIYQHYPCMLPA